MEEDIVDSKTEEILGTRHHSKTTVKEAGTYTNEQGKCQYWHQPRIAVHIAKRGHEDANEPTKGTSGSTAVGQPFLFSRIFHFQSMKDKDMICCQVYDACSPDTSRLTAASMVELYSLVT